NDSLGNRHGRPEFALEIRHRSSASPRCPSHWFWSVRYWFRRRLVSRQLGDGRSLREIDSYPRHLLSRVAIAFAISFCVCKASRIVSARELARICLTNGTPS